LRDRIGERELALLDEQHRTDADDRFRLRGDPEQRVLGHPGARFAVAEADGFEKGDTAAASDECDAACDLAALDVALERRAEALEPHRRKPAPLRLRALEREGVRGEREQTEGEEPEATSRCKHRIPPGTETAGCRENSDSALPGATVPGRRQP